MAIKDIFRMAGFSVDELASITNVPSSTLSDIMSGKTRLQHCQAKTLQKISRGLGLSMEELLKMDEMIIPDSKAPSLHKLVSPEAFIVFRSDLLGLLNDLGERDFVSSVVKSHAVEGLYDDKLYPQALYAIGLIDYLCDKNGIPRQSQYDKYRGDTMEKTVYGFAATENPDLDYIYFQHMIPQMLKFNFIETPDSLQLTT